MIPTREHLTEYFESRVSKVDGHWLWTGGKNEKGYGVCYFTGYGSLKAHRLSCHLFHGMDRASPLYALHKCDRRDCVNPEHLYVGTQSDNLKDAYKGGTRKRHNK